MAKRVRLPTDVNSRARAIVDLATSGEDLPDPDEGKDPAALALSRRGAAKGGRARAAQLTSEQRSESARKAAKARWASRES